MKTIKILRFLISAAISHISSIFICWKKVGGGTLFTTATNTKDPQGKSSQVYRPNGEYYKSLMKEKNIQG